MAWLRAQGERAQYVTSVCTGSLVLGAAGLLKGYRAGCHWAWRDLLTSFGAIPVAERVVKDRNRITGGGVTAGIDFAFAMLAELRGADAQRLLRSVNGIGGAHLGAICAELDSVALRLRNYVAHSPRCGAAEHWASGVAEVERAQSAAWIEEGASVALLPTIGAFAAAGATFAKSQFALAVHRVLSRVALVAEQVFILADALPMFREVESEKTLSVVLARTLAEHRTKMVVARRVGLVLQKLEQAKLVVQRRRGSSGGAGAPALSAEALVAAQAELAAAEPLLRDLPDPRWRVALSEQLALLRAQLA
jgi:hypothetical protein